MELFVIRHTSVSGVSGLCYGQSEVPLSASFETESEVLLKAFSEPADVVFTSPLDRCRRLAERLPAAKVIADDRLKEVFFGEWEGRRWEELPEADVRTWADDFVHARPPGGESLVSLAARTADFLEGLRGQPYNRVAVVTHAGFVRCAWAHLLGIPLSHIFRLDIPYGQGYRLDWAFPRLSIAGWAAFPPFPSNLIHNATYSFVFRTAYSAGRRSLPSHPFFPANGIPA